MIFGLLCSAAATGIFFLRDLCDSSVLSAVKSVARYSPNSR